MDSTIKKRDFLCSLAEKYLDTKENSCINVNDGIINSNDFDSNSFLMLLALVYEKKEANNIYSMDIEVSEEIRQYFIENEYLKIKKLNDDEIILGKMILQDARKIYQSQYDEDNVDIDEIGKNFFI